MASVPKATQQPSSLVGHGEFTGNDNAAARQLFLDALAEVDSSVLPDLERWARRLAAEKPPNTSARFASLVREWVMAPTGSLSLNQNELVDSEIQRLLSRLRLRACDWVAAAMLWTLTRWTDALVNRRRCKRRILAAPVMDGAGNLCTDDVTSWVLVPELDPAQGVFRLTLDVPFNLRTDRIKAIEEGVLSYVQRELRRELDRAKQACLAAGLELTPEKRGDRQRHFRWLVRWHVLGESLSEIAIADSVSRQSVDEGIRGVALLINLELRDPDPGGRPKIRS